MPCILRFALLALACLALNRSLEAQEWSRFRGPNGQGHAPAGDIPIAWEKDQTLWKVELPGKGNSSPVLWGDRIFLTGANPGNGTRHMLCLSARDGSPLWREDFPSTTYPVHVQNTFASSTPAVDARHVYFAWATPDEFTLMAFDHDGREAWRLELGKFVGQHGFAASPIVYRDMVILVNDQDSDSFLLAVDSGSGTVRWKVPRKVLVEQNASYSAPCVWQRDGRPDELLLSGRSHGVTSIDPTDGSTNWELSVHKQRAVASPVVCNGLIFATSGNGAGANTLVAVAPPGEDGKPRVAYTIERGPAPYVPTLIAHGALAFLWSDRGIVACIDAATGHEHWRERIGGNYYSSPVLVGDRIYNVSLEGEVVVLAASSDYELLGRSELGETCRATPAVAGGRMYLRTESHLLAVGRR